MQAGWRIDVLLALEEGIDAFPEHRARIRGNLAFLQVNWDPYSSIVIFRRLIRLQPNSIGARNRIGALTPSPNTALASAATSRSCR